MAYNGEGGPISEGIGYGPDYYTWDAPAYAVPGVYEDIIAKDFTVYPKLKHWYQGDFPSQIAGINWLIKTMDRPKIDIESVEQMRNNVMRNYPVRYSFGDLSITFWDDIDHKTVTTLNNYFQKSVWSHMGEKQFYGELLLRDSIVIPQFKITEFSIESKPTVVYTFYNSVLSSLDFDGEDDEGDESLFTVLFAKSPFNSSIETGPICCPLTA